MLWSKFHYEWSIDKVLVFWVSDEREIDHFWVMINARVIHEMTFWWSNGICDKLSHGVGIRILH
jgi:hypothetical protein